MTDANLNVLWSRALLEELKRSGVRHAVVCPGSRSSPLALGCAEQFQTWSVIDERSAAFFALGIAKQSGAPVVLVATSGTAGAHFYPALIEAAASHVPLIALTADRPLELQGWGAPQTIDQGHLFGRFVRMFADLGIPEASGPSLLHLRATAARAASASLRAPRGPVHLNVPFREPLAPTPDGLDVSQLPPRAVSGTTDAPLVSLVPPVAQVRPDALERLKARMRSAERGVIIAGPRDAQDGLGEAAIALGRAYGFPVLAEAASNVRFAQEGVVTVYDGILRHPGFASRHTPELVLHLGGGLTTKVIRGWLDKSGAHLVQLSDSGQLHDPQHVGAEVLEGDPVAACRALVEGQAPRASKWAQDFAEAERRARIAVERAMAQTRGLSEPAVAREVAAQLPEGAQLFVSSSMPIRDLDTFASSAAAVRVLSNRGVNGIDGIVSTALGISASSGAPTVLLTGDVAFLHDLGGLLTAKRHRLPLTIVVVQNDGGGIFSFLPIAQFRDHYEPLFGTPHGVPLEHAAAMFGGQHHQPETVDALRRAVVSGLEGGLHLIEARTDRAENVREHARLFAAIADALGDGTWS